MLKIQNIIPAREIAREYDAMYITYCRMKSRDNLELQLMLINKPLQAWFRQQYQNNLMKFENIILNSRLPIKVTTAQQLYRIIAYSFFDKFNKKISYDIQRQAKRIRSEYQGTARAIRPDQIYLN